MNTLAPAIVLDWHQLWVHHLRLMDRIVTMAIKIPEKEPLQPQETVELRILGVQEEVRYFLPLFLRKICNVHYMCISDDQIDQSYKISYHLGC